MINAQGGSRIRASTKIVHEWQDREKLKAGPPTQYPDFRKQETLVEITSPQAREKGDAKQKVSLTQKSIGEFAATRVRLLDQGLCLGYYHVATTIVALIELFLVEFPDSFIRNPNLLLGECLPVSGRHFAFEDLTRFGGYHLRPTDAAQQPP